MGQACRPLPLSALDNDDLRIMPHCGSIVPTEIDGSFRCDNSNRAEQCPLCPNTSDFDLLSDGKRIIDLDSEISDGTFHFLVAKQS